MNTVITEDKVQLHEDDKAFNYYDMKVGTIGPVDTWDGWFTFIHSDGTSTTLNGERICSIEFAIKKGWL